MIPIYVIGPTAVGKTQLSVALAQRFDAEIISVDSTMVYRGMDVGSAKPSLEECQGIPHHLIDVCDPGAVYSAGSFVRDVARLISEIQARGRRPLLVGGTMMYWHVWLHGLAAVPSANAELRQTIEQQAQAKGWPYLHEELKKKDPKRAADIHPNDGVRIQRALELCALTGKTVDELWRVHEPPFREAVSIILVPRDRDWLRSRIAERFVQMIHSGLIEEVEALLRHPSVTPDWVGLRAVGYRQVLDYLKGLGSRSDLMERGIIATQQFAKRQRVWLNRYAVGGCVRADQDWMRVCEDAEKTLETMLGEAGSI